MLVFIRRFFNDQKGVGVVEIILILLVLVGLVLIFKNQIMNIAESIFTGINDQIKEL